MPEWECGWAADRHQRDDACARRERRFHHLAADKFRSGKLLRWRFKELRECEKPADGAVFRIMLAWTVRLARGLKPFIRGLIVRAATTCRTRFRLAGQTTGVRFVTGDPVVQTMLKARQKRQQGGKSRGDRLSSRKAHGRTQLRPKVSAVRPDRNSIAIVDPIVNGIYEVSPAADRLFSRMHKFCSTGTIVTTDTAVTGWASHVGGTQLRRPFGNRCARK